MVGEGPGRSRQRGDDVIRRDGLHEGGRQADYIAVGTSLDDAIDELEELRRAEDRIWNFGYLDQVLLEFLVRPF